MEEAGSIERFYQGWEKYNRAIVEIVRDMTPEHLAIRPSPDGWPIWATVAHVAGVRTYWLCGVFGEPGAETTPFVDAASGMGWEDEDTPRTAEELVFALESSWRIVEATLRRWTVPTLEETVVRQTHHGKQVHTRQSVIFRLLNHDSYHAGELSQTLGIHHLPQIDFWKPEYVAETDESPPAGEIG